MFSFSKLSFSHSILVAALLAFGLIACGGSSNSSDDESGDTLAPVITINGDNPTQLVVGNDFVDLGATAIDETDGEVPVSTSGSVDNMTIGSYQITYSASDLSGNATSSIRTVNVISITVPDNEAPVITLLGNNPEQVAQGSDYIDAGATALDNVDGNISVIVTGNVDTSTLGSYTLTYTATDSSGNNSMIERVVNVVEVVISNSYAEDFTAADDSAWPDEWQIPNEPDSPLTEATIQGNRAYLEGESGGQRVTRMVMQSVQMQDFEASFSIQFSNLTTQGIGFYGRQNGGRLLGTDPTGQGYAVFIEGYSSGGSSLNLTLWHELDGDEVRDAATNIDQLTASNEQVYRVRYRVEQESDIATRLSARIWAVEDNEPTEWQVTFLSSSNNNPGVSVLQNLSAGFAVDVYNQTQTDGIYIDDIEIEEIN